MRNSRLAIVAQMARNVRLRNPRALRKLVLRHLAHRFTQLLSKRPHAKQTTRIRVACQSYSGKSENTEVDDSLAANHKWVRLGEYLRSVREDRKISQDALAEKAGLSQSAISRLERGENKKNDPGAVVLSSIAPILGLSLDTLIHMARADAIADGTLIALSAEPQFTPPASVDRLQALVESVEALRREVSDAWEAVAATDQRIARAVALLGRETGLPDATILRMQQELRRPA
jgi:transcriptional regulator with XRE-family HTH domain